MLGYCAWNVFVLESFEKKFITRVKCDKRHDERQTTLVYVMALNTSIIEKTSANLGIPECKYQILAALNISSMIRIRFLRITRSIKKAASVSYRIGPILRTCHTFLRTNNSHLFGSEAQKRSEAVWNDRSHLLACVIFGTFFPFFFFFLFV